jgi:hypothetical protein
MTKTATKQVVGSTGGRLAQATPVEVPSVLKNESRRQKQKGTCFFLYHP